MRFACLALVMIAAPLSAGADEVGFLREGIEGCYTTIGEDATVTHDLMFESYGWEGDTDPEMGLGFLYPPADSQVFITVALDGSFCQVESATIDSATASEHLRAVLDQFGQEVEYDKDDMGCTRLTLGDGYAATITSAGNDPTCGSDENSALRFTYE
jgi:hypothetical protein